MSEVRLKKDGTPAKKRGRRPGCVKTGGRKRLPKPVSIEMTPTETRHFFLPKWAQAIDDILEGRTLEFSGKTGKTITRKRTSEEFMHAIKELGAKLLPSLQSQAVKAEVDTVVTTNLNCTNPDDRRHLAKSVLKILSGSQIDYAADEAALIGTRPQPPPLPRSADIMVQARPTLEAWDEKQRQIEHGTTTSEASEPVPASSGAKPSPGDVGEGEALPASLSDTPSLSSAAASNSNSAAGQDGEGEISAPSSSVAIPPHHQRPHAFRVDAQGYGKGHMLWHSELRRWFFFDDTNHEHGAVAGVRGDDKKALARLEELGRSSLPWQEHPWHVFGGDTLNSVERRDNRLAPPDQKPNIVRRMPRGSR